MRRLMETCLAWLLSDQWQALQAVQDHRLAQERQRTDDHLEALRHDLAALTLAVATSRSSGSVSLTNGELTIGIDPHLGRH